MNRAFLALLGKTEDQLQGQPIRDHIPEAIRGEWMAARKAVLEEGGVVELEIPWKVEGVTRTFLATWFLLTDGGRVSMGLGMIGTDLSERMRAEEERLRMEAQFRHTQKLESLGVLAVGIAHDFNNILAAILGNAELATDALDSDPREARESFAQVAAAAQRAAELTNQMLAYAGRATFRIQTVDLNRTIREMSSFMSVSLPKKVELILRLSSEPLTVRANPAQLSQVVMDLITNAAQAMGNEVGRVEVSTATAQRGGGVSRAVLRVRDTGIGMDAETRERIFDPFFTTKEQGRGLGLAAVIGIINTLDGTIEVESEVGKGSTFTVLLPREEDDPEGPSDGEISGSGARAREVRGTVLVVDDEDAVRRFSVRALRRNGLQVLEARDGLAALEAFRDADLAVDAVVLDLSMPGMGGLEVFEKLRAEKPGLPVLFISGSDPADEARGVAHDPRVGFLQKPFRPRELVGGISAFLAGGDD